MEHGTSASLNITVVGAAPRLSCKATRYQTSWTSSSGGIKKHLAFIAHLRCNVFYQEVNDRHVIQALKRDDMRRGQYVERVKTEKGLLAVLRRLLVELRRHPLHNSSQDPDYPEIDRWWNSSVRNNLFHGGKNPSVARDCFLVEHAYETLKVFMDTEVAMVTPGQKATSTQKPR